MMTAATIPALSRDQIHTVNDIISCQVWTLSRCRTIFFLYKFSHSALLFQVLTRFLIDTGKPGKMELFFFSWGILRILKRVEEFVMSQRKLKSKILILTSAIEKILKLDIMDWNYCPQGCHMSGKNIFSRSGNFREFLAITLWIVSQFYLKMFSFALLPIFDHI